MKKQKHKIFSGQKALVMGLGLHGGGIATSKWLAKNGATVTATDKRTKEVLTPSLQALKGVKVKFILGEHRDEDFATNDLIVANPAVPRESPYLAIARNRGKRIENDASLFFCYNDNPVIAVTGTRGKTTTTLWIAELLKKQFPHVRPSGNTPENALLKEFDRVQGKNIPVVAELSSWQLEYLPTAPHAPHVAVITNLFPDHLNRYKGGMPDYASAKANIFFNQREDDFLVLNYDNEWTKFFQTKKPKGVVFYFHTKSLPKGVNGLFVREGMLIFRFDGIEQKLFSVKKFVEARGIHNLENLLATVLAIKLFDATIAIKEEDVLDLPTPRMRQEIILKKGKLTVVNDSCATSPDGVIAALKRFGGLNTILITGGTDKELEFSELARVIKKYVQPAHLVLLEGSATTKLLVELVRQKYFKGHAGELHTTLASCARTAQAIAISTKGKTTILFSPGAASFEKFLHEFDRGEKFNTIVKKMKV